MADVGIRVTDANGDEARFERYRDLRNGLFTNIVFGKQTDGYLLDVTAKNIGYRDQQYAVDYQNSKFRFSFLFDSIPLNYCYNCLTPWREPSANSWVLDDAVQNQVQKSRYPAPVTPLPAGYVAIPANYLAEPADLGLPRPWRRPSRCSPAATRPASSSATT